MIDWLLATMNTVPSGKARMLQRVVISNDIGRRMLRTGYTPREQVRRQTSLQERRRADSVLLAREELEAARWVDVIEHSLFMHAPNDYEAAVEDASSGGVPPLLDKDQVRVFEESTALPR